MAVATFCARVAAAARARVNKKMRKQTREFRVQKPFVELSGRIRSLCAKHFKAHNDADVTNTGNGERGTGNRERESGN